MRRVILAIVAWIQLPLLLSLAGRDLTFSGRTEIWKELPGCPLWELVEGEAPRVREIPVRRP